MVIEVFQIYPVPLSWQQTIGIGLCSLGLHLLLSFKLISLKNIKASSRYKILAMIIKVLVKSKVVIHTVLKKLCYSINQSSTHFILD